MDAWAGGALQTASGWLSHLYRAPYDYDAYGLNLLKYDGRTREGKAAIARGRLRMITATDEDLKELAELEQSMSGQDEVTPVPERVEELKKERAALRKKGIQGGELECRARK